MLAFGVAYAPRTLVLVGMPWILGDRQVVKWSEVEFVGLTDKLELSQLRKINPIELVRRYLLLFFSPKRKLTTELTSDW